LETPDYTYLDTSKIQFFIDERTSDGKFWLYQGTDLRNTTALIENNSEAVIGAPYEVPVGDKMIVVF
jgi:hypothetical protein